MEVRQLTSQRLTEVKGFAERLKGQSGELIMMIACMQPPARRLSKAMLCGMVVIILCLISCITAEVAPLAVSAYAAQSQSAHPSLQVQQSGESAADGSFRNLKDDWGCGCKQGGACAATYDLSPLTLTK